MIRKNSDNAEDVNDFKKIKLSAASEFRKQVSSKDFSKIKKAGKLGHTGMKLPAFKHNGDSKSDKFYKGSNGESGGTEKVYEKLTPKQRKKLREKRRAYYDDAVMIKKQWELLRSSDDKKEKQRLSEEILKQIEGKEKLLQLCQSHDTCRVISWAYRCCGEERRKILFQTFIGAFETLG